MTQFNSIEVPERVSRAESSVSARPSGTKSRWWIWLLVIVAGAMGAWYFGGGRGAANRGDAATAGKGRAGAGPNGFVVPVVVAAAQRGDLPVYFNGLGTVTAFNTVTVRSRIDGQLIKVSFTEGQFVHLNDLLAEIDSRPYQVQLEQAEGQLAKDTAQHKDAEVNFERFKLLFQEGVIPKQQLDSQQALVGQTDGAIRTDQAQIDNAKLQLTYCRIIAPISGRIGLRLVDAGNMVHATDANGLLVITQLQPISVIFSLPQDQLPQVYSKLHSTTQLPVEAYDRDDTTKIASGKLVTIDNQIDLTTGTYKLKSIFSNEHNVLFPNQFVNVHLLVDTLRNLVLVPAPAVLRGQQGTYVYAVGNDNTVKIHNVTIARTTGDTVGLSAGLQPGEVVVIDGQDKLQDGSKVKTSMAPGASRASQPSSGQPAAQSAPRGGAQTAGRAR